MELVVLGGPALIGFLCGLTLTIRTNIFFSFLIVLAAGYLFISTADDGLGSLIGLLPIIPGGIFMAMQWATIGIKGYRGDT